ncbi:MAG: Tex family protein [Acholeplasmataceae bacterium]|jgi:uncharacterized protein
MNEQVLREVSESLNISLKQINSVLTLLDEGNTIPFIARYRKEATGGLDEEQINAIHKEWEYANNLFNRKEDVIRLIDERGMLTPELKEAILKAEKLVDVEDLYRPYKEKKKTKATEAIAKGLEPLADWMLKFPKTDVIEEAKKYLTEEVPTTEEAIEGAKFIIAERVSDEAEYRKVLRDMLRDYGDIVSTKRRGAEDERMVYEIYYEYQEPVSKIKPHRTLAINRAEKEKVINVKIDLERQMMIEYLNKQVIKDELSTATPYIKEAIDDSLKRLIFPSLEREIRSELTEVAEDQAIDIFALNLHNLLLQPPLKGRVILGVDPAFRTGCKLAVVNKLGKVLEVDTIYPHIFGESRRLEAARKVFTIVNRHKVELIAIGNGTASRETEEFIADLIKETNLKVQYVIVNEAGASVYSASELAREEFPDLEVEQRSAASIARRLQDPLSELVKIDPKSIGVGQYQHDVTPKKLNDQLNFVVTQAVNSVGVDVNTASKALLIYVSGLTKRTADSIVERRNKLGRYNSREELLDVPYLGEKSYEQAVGFLRIRDGQEALDMTSIHPESYLVAKEIMKKFNITGDMFGKPEIELLFYNVDRNALAKELNVDRYTLDDIMDSFVAPLRDPRDEFPQPILKSGVLSLDDLHEGMELQGTVRNVVDFGAFIDVGLHEDGLLHISKMRKSYVKHPSDVVSVGDIVKVYVLSVDKDRGKVALTMIKN